MGKVKDITVILPLHKLNEDYLLLLNSSLSSIEDFGEHVKVMLVAPPEVTRQLENLSETLDITVIENNTEDTSVQRQVNVGVQHCETEWFSILEVDDEYSRAWFKSARGHIDNYGEYDAFLPIVKDVNVEGQIVTLTNEAVWAHGFTDRIGELTLETLLEYHNFQVSGGLYRTKTVLDNGGMFKEDIQLTFGYEFLLRMLNNNAKIMVMPRVGYTHVNFREDSLFWLYQKDEKMKLTEEETLQWLNVAKQEYLHNDKQDTIERTD